MSHRFRRVWLFALLSIFALAAFQMLFIGALHMHPDEELSYRAIDGDLAFTIHYQQSMQDNQAPVWFVTFWAWQGLAGEHEFTGRMLGVLLTMLTMAMVYRLGRAWFASRSRWIGVAAPLLLIGNGLFFNYSLDIRPYPLVMLCATLSMWAFSRWMTWGTLRTTILYGLTVALLLYVHYLLAFLVVAHGIYVVFARGFSRRWLGQGVLATAIGVGLWLPWFPTFVYQVVGVHSVELASGTARGIAGIGVSTQATSPHAVLNLLQVATNGLAWLYGLVLIGGFIRLWRDKHYRLTLLWALGVPAIYLTANLVAAVYAPRYVSYAMIGLALALSASLLTLPRRLRLVAVAIFVEANLLTFGGTIPVRVPYRDIYDEMSRLAVPGDAVLFYRAGEGDGFVQWQYRHYMSPELQAGITTDVNAAGNARRIWFLTGDWYDDEVNAIFDALRQTHLARIALGQCNRAWCYVAWLMEAPP